MSFKLTMLERDLINRLYIPISCSALEEFLQLKKDAEELRYNVFAYKFKEVIAETTKRHLNSFYVINNVQTPSYESDASSYERECLNRCKDYEQEIADYMQDIIEDIFLSMIKELCKVLKQQYCCKDGRVIRRCDDIIALLACCILLKANIHALKSYSTFISVSDILCDLSYFSYIFRFKPSFIFELIRELLKHDKKNDRYKVRRHFIIRPNFDVRTVLNKHDITFRDLEVPEANQELLQVPFFYVDTAHFCEHCNKITCQERIKCRNCDRDMKKIKSSFLIDEKLSGSDDLGRTFEALIYVKLREVK